MSSTGTRVVPTLTEVLDEQRLSKPSSNLSTETWQDSRPGDEELVPISLDWGDEPALVDPADETTTAGDVMTPWHVVQPRVPELPGDAPFIDLSIDVAPVRPPALHEQVLEVYAPLPVLSDDRGPSLDAGLLSAVPVGELPVARSSAEAQPVAADAASQEQTMARDELAPWSAEFAASEVSGTAPSDAPAVQSLAALPALGALGALGGSRDAVALPAPAAVLSTGGRDTPRVEPAEPCEVALQPVLRPDSPPALLDPGAQAVRQGSEHVPGISEERLQFILQQALDRLLRDELPSALVETLIRMSPQLSESLIESLKPSLHLHVLEALSAEPVTLPEARSLG